MSTLRWEMVQLGAKALTRVSLEDFFPLFDKCGVHSVTPVEPGARYGHVSYIRSTAVVSIRASNVSVIAAANYTRFLGLHGTLEQGIPGNAALIF